MRAHDGPGRLLLRDGRQPRQLSGQSVLGIRQARQDQGKGLPHLLVLGRRPALAALVATRELYTVVPGGDCAERIARRAGCCSGVREHGLDRGWPETDATRLRVCGQPGPETDATRAVGAGAVSTAWTEGGLRQMRPGSVSADNPSGSAPADVALGSVLADNPPEADAVGLYVHVPFCAKRCGYCSFNTAPLEDGAMVRYLEALQREIDLLGALAWSPRVRLATVFLGGGTPSLLTAADLAATLDRIRARFTVTVDAEITVECNPESVTREKLEGYHAAGVNRLSLGVQSLDDSILPRLGRLHDARGARAAFEAARESGCANLSVDLMYGLPGLDLDGWTRAVDTVLDWRPDHLSAYGLTLDAGSLWGASAEQLSPRQRLAERLILGLRTADGVPTVWLEARLDGERDLRRRIETWRAQALLVDTGDRVRLTEAGFLLSDALFVELL